MLPHNPQRIAFRKKKDLALFLLTGIVLSAVGAWLVWSFLEHQGLHPFSTSPSASPVPIHTKGFMPSVLYWETNIQAWAEAWDLDPLLVATVMQIESCGNPAVASPAGAQGLFQVMPYHFLPGENMLDPQTNAARGLAYLAQSYTLSGGDITLTLAGYNGGHGQITRSQELWPDETQRYAAWGKGIYHEAKSGDPNAPTLTAWLQAGGYLLCEQAEAQLGVGD